MTPTPVPRTLEIIIQTGSGPADGPPSFPLVARLVDSDQTASGALNLPFSPAQLDRALNWIEDGLFNDDYVRAFGGQLFDALFAGPVRDLYRELRRSESGKSRLRILTGDARAARVPWELLYDSERQSFVALDLAVVRGLALTGETRPLASTAFPLRVLLVESFPAGLPRLQGAGEAEDVRSRLAGLARRRQVETQRLGRSTLSELQNALREAAAADRPFHVLHLIGHGRSDRETGKAVLLFEAEDGQPEEVPPAALAGMLAQFDVRLAFLNACQSAQSSAFDLAEGFAPALLGAGVPCVIGMQVGVVDEVARRFAGEFYAALADSQPVDLALTNARRLALGEGSRRKADMAIPVCYLRPPSGQILKLRAPEAVPLTRATLGPWLRQTLRPRRLLRSVYGVLAVVGTLLGLYLAVQAIVRDRTPGAMDGNFNIAVAAFGKLDEQGRANESLEGRGFARDFYTELQTAIEEEQPRFQVWGPPVVPAVLGDTAEQRRRTAESWAAEHNVDLLIYGNVRSQRTRSEILPVFYVADKRLPFAQEVSGHYNLDADISDTGENVLLDGNAATSDFLRKKLEGWAGEIARFSLGLGAFSRNSYEDAQRYLGEAVPAEDAANTAQWRKVVNLFRGSAAGSLGQYDAAESYYDQALAIDSTYARALLGKAQMVFLRARRGCTLESQTDVEGLQESLRLYEQAGAARAEPEAEIAVKVNYFSGAAELCLGIATGDQTLAEPLRSFSAVIDEYQARASDTDRQGHIAYLAAASYIARGAAYVVLSNKGADSDYAAKARADLEAARAPDLTSRGDRMAVASWWLGRLHLWNNACPAASDEIARGDRSIEQYAKDNPSANLSDAASLRCAVASEPATKCSPIPVPPILHCPAGAN